MDGKENKKFRLKIPVEELENIKEFKKQAYQQAVKLAKEEGLEGMHYAISWKKEKGDDEKGVFTLKIEFS